jgi:hypothetical protein
MSNRILFGVTCDNPAVSVGTESDASAEMARSATSESGCIPDDR